MNLETHCMNINWDLLFINGVCLANSILRNDGEIGGMGGIGGIEGMGG